MSTIKVDTIQTRTGSGNITVSNNIVGGGTISGTNITASGTLGVTGAATFSGGIANTGTISAGTLGANVQLPTGTHLQTVIVKDTAGLVMSGNQTARHLNVAITSKFANSSFLVRYSTGIYTVGSHNSDSPWNIDSDHAIGLGFKTGSASTTSTDYTAISTSPFSRENITFSGSTSRAFYSSDAIGGSANYMYRYHPGTTVFTEDMFSPSQAAGTVINVGAFVSQDGGNSNNFYIGKSPSGFGDSGYQSFITVTELAP